MQFKMAATPIQPNGSNVDNFISTVVKIRHFRKDFCQKHDLLRSPGAAFIFTGKFKNLFLKQLHATGTPKWQKHKQLKTQCPGFLFHFVTIQEDSFYFPCGGGRVYKNKESWIELGRRDGLWVCGTDREELQVALFSTKLFTEESSFFF